ncbi:ABC transporter permease [Jonesia quinghaiensis]|uniref:ABC transporter permease n=1 Tax=Jonesia quinghaiensis TaxID=262806 RepID=UPI000420955F|nr:ABC transporter permease [Jonesia quinghaiensis]
MQSTQLSSLTAIRLVAGRELRVHLRNKAMIISTLVMVVLIVGGLFAANFFGNQEQSIEYGVTSSTEEVGQATQSVLESQGITVDVTTYSDEAQGRTAVSDGEISALITGSGSDITAVVNESVDSDLNTALASVIQQTKISELAQSAGVSPDDINSVYSLTEVPFESLDPPAEIDGSQILVGFIVGFLLYLGIFGGGMSVAQGVVEEKSSRVVEVLLASVRPWQLLTGKVIGIGLVSLLQVGIYVGAGVAAATAFGLTEDITLDLNAIGAWVLVWFLLGYIIYALVFAALGALVSRQEDLGSVIPIPMFIVIAAYIIGVSVAPSDPDSPVVTIASYIPFTSPIVMPIRSAYGVASTVEVFAALAAAVITIPILLWISSKIYSNAVRRSGARIKLKDALKAA